MAQTKLRAADFEPLPISIYSEIAQVRTFGIGPTPMPTEHGVRTAGIRARTCTRMRSVDFNLSLKLLFITLPHCVE